MKSVVFAAVFLVAGFVLGSFFHTMTVRAADQPRVEKVDISSPSLLSNSGKAVSISCVAIGDKPECYVLMQ